MTFLNDLKNHFFEMADQFTGVTFTGDDSERFLNGQLTNNVSNLKNGEFQLQARLDRNGRLKGHFYLLKNENGFTALAPNSYFLELKEDLEKYIIMDDVELNEIENNFSMIFTPVEKLELLIDPDEIKSQYKGSVAFLPCFLTEARVPKSWSRISPESLEELFLLRGEPVIGITSVKDTLVTDTVVNLSGVSLKKGCFLGQETVSKIETRRGGARFPMLLETSNKLEIEEGADLFIEGKKAGTFIKNLSHQERTYVLVSLLRNFRVDGREYSFETDANEFKGKVIKLPLGGEFDKESFLESKYEEAVLHFQNDEVEKAMDIFNQIIDVNPKHEDALESLGVVLGRLERFEEGLDLMEKVLEANPDSVMAHTNKSLFLMRLGKIEEAEEEKAQATVKSFGQFGKEAQAKKEQEEAEKQRLAEIDRKMSMFQQVLEIDPEDELANYGLADVHYHKDNPKESIPLLEKVVSGNPKYSVAYLLLGKCYIKLNQKDKAREVFEKGIEIASAQGDMMPANEMQAKLLGLR